MKRFFGAFLFGGASYLFDALLFQPQPKDAAAKQVQKAGSPYYKIIDRKT